MSQREMLEGEDVPDQARDAARWQALLSSARMRIITTVRQPYDASSADYLAVEFWSRSIIQSTHLAKQILINYADAIIKAETEN